MLPVHAGGEGLDDPRPEVPHVEVAIDTTLCVGNGACLEAAPLVFAHDESRQSTVRRGATSDESRLLRAAESCPVMAIRLTRHDADGSTRLFP